MLREPTKVVDAMRSRTPTAFGPTANVDQPEGRAVGMRGPMLVAVALALTLVSGAAALVHELVWTRRLVDLLGASGESTTRVFGCFFLGLALGAAYSTRVIRRARHPWRGAAYAEIAVGLLSLLVWSLPRWSDWIWPALGPEQLIGYWGGATKLGLSAVLVGAPAACMGLVLPLVAAGVVARGRSVGREGVWLYTANTFGGVLGILLLMGVLLPLVGANGAMLFAAGLNAILGLACLAVDRFEPARDVSAAKQLRREPISWGWLAIAFWSGFGILAFEVTAAQMVMLFAPLTFFAPMTILVTVLLLLALASAAIARRSAAHSPRMPALLVCGGAALAAAPLLFQLATQMFTPQPSASLSLFLGKLTLFGIVTLGPAVFLAGLVFPRVVQLASGGLGHGVEALGWLLAVNGLGGFLGAEVAYRVLLPNFGVFATCGVLGAAYATAAAASYLLEQHAQRLGMATLALGAAALLAFFTTTWLSSLPHQSPEVGAAIVEEIFGRDGPVAVIEHPALGRAILMSNQYVLGGTKTRFDQERQAHLPLVLRDPGDVAFIGVATGITPGAAALHARWRATAVELSPQVVEAAKSHFAAFNHDLAASAERLVVEDGRTYIAACTERFDAVVGDLFLPWAPGEGRLFSLEHFRAVARSLRPGGVYCQWLPMYQLTPEQFDIILATFRRVFPTVHLFRGTFGLRQPTLALVGFKDADLDWSTVARRADEISRDGAVRDPLLVHREGLAMLYVGRCTADPPRAAINTLDNLALELSAGYERVTGTPGEKYLDGQRWFEFLEALVASGGQGASQPDEIGRMQRLGLDVSRWELARSEDDAAEARELQRRILAELPESLVDDARENLKYWPGNRELLMSSSR